MCVHIPPGGRCYDFRKYFRKKVRRKNWRVWLKFQQFRQTKMIITLVFFKLHIFFAGHWQKLQKMFIITLTPGHALPTRGHRWTMGAHATGDNLNQSQKVTDMYL
jgi:hypothetical protein